VLYVTEIDPFGPGRWSTLHKEELARGAVGIALHHHCAICQMRQQKRGDITVILKQVALCYSQPVPKKLPKIGKPYNSPFNFHFNVLLISWEN